MRITSAVAVLLATGLLSGCGEEDIGAENERIASGLTGEMEVADQESGDVRATDVRCVRPRAGVFDCRVYKLRPRDRRLADIGHYRVTDCGNGQWRAVAENGSDPAFPEYLAHDTGSEIIKSECVALDRRHSP